MTPTDAHLEEATAATLAYQAALAKIGAASVAEAILIWRRLGPTRQAQAATQWMDEALLMIGSRRGRSRELALAYYRLVRALRTGRTIPSIYDPEPTVVTLGQLRDEFAALAGDADDALPPDQDPAPTNTNRDSVRPGEGSPRPDTSAYNPDRPGGDEEVPVDHDGLPIDEIEEILDRDEVEEEEDARSTLERLGPKYLDKSLSKLDGDKMSGNEVDAARDDVQRKVESAQAAGAALHVKNGGRNLVHRISQADPRCVGFVRTGVGDSCYFCQMLISRGPVYFNKASAERTAEGKAYHPNCDCTSTPVFMDSDYSKSDLFKLNRDLEKIWRSQIEGTYSGDDAVYEWRRIIEGRRNGPRRRR